MLRYLILLIVVYLIIAPRSSSQGGNWKVYGSMGCGWTKKQLNHLKSKGVSHTFIDCTKQNCNGVDAFPTMIHSQSGEKIVGYSEKI
jgi:hypothetical protein